MDFHMLRLLWLFTNEGVLQPRKGSPDNAFVRLFVGGKQCSKTKENLDVVTIPGCIGTSEADEAAAAAAAAIGEVSK